MSRRTLLIAAWLLSAASVCYGRYPTLQWFQQRDSDAGAWPENCPKLFGSDTYAPLLMTASPAGTMFVLGAWTRDGFEPGSSFDVKNPSTSLLPWLWFSRDGGDSWDCTPTVDHVTRPYAGFVAFTPSETIDGGYGQEVLCVVGGLESAGDMDQAESGSSHMDTACAPGWKATSQVHCTDDFGLTWMVQASLPFPAAFTSATAAMDLLYVFAGGYNSSHPTVVEAMDRAVRVSGQPLCEAYQTQAVIDNDPLHVVPDGGPIWTARWVTRGIKDVALTAPSQPASGPLGQASAYGYLTSWTWAATSTPLGQRLHPGMRYSRSTGRLHVTMGVTAVMPMQDQGASFVPPMEQPSTGPGPVGAVYHGDNWYVSLDSIDNCSAWTQGGPLSDYVTHGSSNFVVRGWSGRTTDALSVSSLGHLLPPPGFGWYRTANATVGDVPDLPDPVDGSLGWYGTEDVVGSWAAMDPSAVVPLDPDMPLLANSTVTAKLLHMDGFSVCATDSGDDWVCYQHEAWPLSPYTQTQSDFTHRSMWHGAIGLVTGPSVLQDRAALPGPAKPAVMAALGIRPANRGSSYPGRLLLGYSGARCSIDCTPRLKPVPGWQTTTIPISSMSSSGCTASPWDATCDKCEHCVPGSSYESLACGMPGVGGTLSTVTCKNCRRCNAGWDIVRPCSGPNNTICGPILDAVPVYVTLVQPARRAVGAVVAAPLVLGLVAVLGGRWAKRGLCKSMWRVVGTLFALATYVCAFAVAAMFVDSSDTVAKAAHTTGAPEPVHVAILRVAAMAIMVLMGTALAVAVGTSCWLVGQLRRSVGPPSPTARARSDHRPRWQSVAAALAAANAGQSGWEEVQPTHKSRALAGCCTGCRMNKQTALSVMALAHPRVLLTVQPQSSGQVSSAAQGGRAGEGLTVAIPPQSQGLAIPVSVYARAATVSLALAVGMEMPAALLCMIGASQLLHLGETITGGTVSPAMVAPLVPSIDFWHGAVAATCVGTMFISACWSLWWAVHGRTHIQSRSVLSGKGQTPAEPQGGKAWPSMEAGVGEIVHTPLPGQQTGQGGRAAGNGSTAVVVGSTAGPQPEPQGLGCGEADCRTTYAPVAIAAAGVSLHDRPARTQALLAQTTVVRPAEALDARLGSALASTRLLPLPHASVPSSSSAGDSVEGEVGQVEPTLYSGAASVALAARPSSDVSLAGAARPSATELYARLTAAIDRDPGLLSDPSACATLHQLQVLMAAERQAEQQSQQGGDEDAQEDPSGMATGAGIAVTMHTRPRQSHSFSDAGSGLGSSANGSGSEYSDDLRPLDLGLGLGRMRVQRIVPPSNRR